MAGLGPPADTQLEPSEDTLPRPPSAGRSPQACPGAARGGWRPARITRETRELMTRSKLWKQLLLCIQARTRRTPADLQGSRRALFISFFPTKTLKGQKGNSGKMNSKDAFDPPRPVRHPPSGPAKEGTWAEVPPATAPAGPSEARRPPGRLRRGKRKEGGHPGSSRSDHSDSAGTHRAADMCDMDWSQPGSASLSRTWKLRHRRGTPPALSGPLPPAHSAPSAHAHSPCP